MLTAKWFVFVARGLKSEKGGAVMFLCSFLIIIMDMNQPRERLFDEAENVCITCALPYYVIVTFF